MNASLAVGQFDSVAASLPRHMVALSRLYVKLHRYLRPVEVTREA
jgi:hypothetical protein